jgi:16S rRNA (cytosine967-C5)-methyltransferase
VPDAVAAALERVVAELPGGGEVRLGQQEMAEAVRAGGRLVYATCSSEPEENEDRVSVFLERHPRFRIANPVDTTPNAEALRPVVNDSGFLRTWPFAHGLEAFFAAVLVRE